MNQARDAAAALWDLLTARADAPALWSVALLLAVGALTVTIPFLWRFLEHLITLVHEAGHALVALCWGRRVSSITLHSDTSGATSTVGRERGLGVIATAHAGYPAPTFAAALLTWLVLADRAPLALGVCVLVAGFVLLMSRNLHGLTVSGLSLAALVAVWWYLPPSWYGAALLALSGLLFAGAILSVLEAMRARRQGVEGADAAMLADLTHIPAGFWEGTHFTWAVAGPVLIAWFAWVTR